MSTLGVSVISRFFSLGLAAGALTLMSAHSAISATSRLNFTHLSGTTGGNPAMTGVFRADLSQLSFNIRSLLIVDSNSGTEGSPGAFSGLDLDAVKISSFLIEDAADIHAIPSINLLDFTSRGTFFFPGSQRPPVEDNLFGTSGKTIKGAIATLDSFDANSTTNSSAFGFVSLGDAGKFGFNFTNPIAAGSPLYLYIGEVGNNELIPAEILVGDEPVNVPEPSPLVAISMMGIYFTLRRVQKTKVA